MKTEVEVGGMRPQAKEQHSHQELEEAERILSCSPRAFRGSRARPTPWFWTPAPRTVRG